MLRVTKLSNRTSIKYSGATINTSKAHINNQIYPCSHCHPSYQPNIQGISASSDHFLCSRSTQFQALVQLWASSREWELACHYTWSSLSFPFPFSRNWWSCESSTLDALSWFLPSSISASRRARESFSSSLAYYNSSRSSSNLVMVDDPQV